MLIAAVLIALSTALPANAPAPVSKRPIAIVINGNALPIDPSPRFERGVLFVPVRRTLQALGLPFERSGNRVTTQVGSKMVALNVGARVAQIDGNAVTLDAPSVEVNGVLYAPLRFFTDVLNAQTTFDRRTNTVTIVAQLAGRSEAGLVATGSGFKRLGTVAAVDVLSNPPTLTLGYDTGPKTVPIAPNATIEMQDVNANVTVPGELGDVRPGDFARVEMRKDGRVERVVDAFGSHTGRIVAVAGNQFVLNDGQVIASGRTTEVALNGRAAGFSDLRPGDVVTVRYNVESNEVREVLASRVLPVTETAAGSAIDVSDDASHPLRAGDMVTVHLKGTASGAATFDIGSYVTNLAMHEASPGMYVGSYTIPAGANFAQAPVIGHLTMRGNDVAEGQAPQTVSASSIPPGIADFAPDNGVSVNNDRPAIYATFVANAVGINASSAAIFVNGHDVTSDAVRTPQFIAYVPAYPYPDGAVHVTVRVADAAGNAATKSWTFTIGTH
ncbi:MAG: copper amine oxidase N-terminal domain-containing protein [Candidatus Eremiobacteraeota bacterium]|nr:copper amine oxidase N-terminal domain-containing protein [Candidatus Eremiobacteraeota bacterium]